MTDLSKIPDVTLTPEEEAWLTGFTEGDGWITYCKNNNGFMLAYEQKEPQILQYIRNLLNPWSKGSFFPVSWGGWRLSYASKYAVYGFMALLMRHVVTPNWANKLKVRQRTPSLPWIAGFWDAEGWSGLITGARLHKNLFIGMCQREREVLVDIQRLLKTGSVQSQHGAETERHLRGGSYTPHQDSYRISITTSPNSELVSTLLQHSRCETKKRKLLANIKIIKEWPDVLKAVRAASDQRRQSAKGGGDANDVS